MIPIAQLCFATPQTSTVPRRLTATLRSVSTYTYTQADYVYVVCGPYVYVEVSARKFKVCCKTVKVIPKLPGDSVLPIGGGQRSILERC